MKLQIKDSGAWRNVIRFERATEILVRKKAGELAMLSENQSIVLRIVNDNGRVVSYFDKVGSYWAWRDS